MNTKTIYTDTEDQKANIPPEFREIPNWVLWRYETSATGRPTKIPYQALNPPRTNGTPKAKSNNPNTWSTYKDAVESLAAHKADPTLIQFDGIGWCLPIEPVPDPETGKSYFYWGWDLDDAINPQTGEFNQWESAPVQPAAVAGTYGNTFTEITPSKAGFRFYTKCEHQVPGDNDVKYGPRNPVTGKEPGIEVYSDGRYFTFTGDLLNGASQSVRTCTDETLDLYRQIFPEEPKSNKNKPVATNPTKIESLAIDLAEHKLEDAHRHDLIRAMSGVVIKLAWKRNDIEQLISSLVVVFNCADPQYDIDANRTKYIKALDDMYVRHTDDEPIPGYAQLQECVDAEMFQRVRALKQLPHESNIVTPAIHADIHKTLAMLSKSRLRTMEVAPVEFLKEPFLIKKTVTCFWGKPAHGKSTYVMQMLHELANERKDLMVIYCDIDNPLAFAKDRSERLSQGLEDNICYWGGESRDDEGNPNRPWNIDDPRWIPLIEQANRIGKHPIIVFDTLNSFMDGQDENSNSVMGYFLNCFRKMQHTGATVIPIHHSGKNPTLGPRGGSAFSANCDLSWYVESTFTIDRNIALMTIEAEKTRKGGILPQKFKMDAQGKLRQTEQSRRQINEDAISDFIYKNLGKTENGVIDQWKRLNDRRFTRQDLKDVLDKFIISKKLTKDSKGRLQKPNASCDIAFDNAEDGA